MEVSVVGNMLDTVDTGTPGVKGGALLGSGSVVVSTGISPPPPNIPAVLIPAPLNCLELTDPSVTG